MRIVKVMILVLAVSVASIAARQLIQRRSSVAKVTATKPEVQRQAAIEVVSSVQRHETGKYGLSDVALLDNGDAWAVGYDGQHVDRLYFSNDRGKTWNAVDVPGTGFTMSAITFSDSQHGWAVGGNGLIIRTRDGGKSWELLKPPTRTEASVRVSDLHAVHFANSRVGYVAGHERYGNKTSDEVWGNVEIFCTQDGGDTWRQCYKENQPGSVFQIVTVSESEAFAVLDGVHLLKTDDQGKTWRPVPLSSKYVSSIAFATNGVGWIVGNKGCFQRSDDGGKTWEQPASLTRDFVNRDWQAIAFNSNGTGLAVGENSTLALTTDNGKTWELQTSIKSDHLRVVRIQDSRAVILGAQNAYSIDVSPANAQQAKK
jgi:photosystem II stability/assembly factor-like uncharacterized protein